MNTALSRTDLRNMFNDRIQVYTYDEIKDYRNIDDLLGEYGRCIILYFWQTVPSCYGHWTACFKLGNGDIEFFDSFSSVPDGELKDIPKLFRNHNGMEYPYLTKLLYNSPYNIHYNNMKIQNDDSSCCGRYCALRIANADKSIDEFNKLWTRDTKANDKLVVRLTNL